MAPTESTSSATVDTSWTTVHTVDARPGGRERFDGLNLTFQNDDAGGTVSFRVRARAGASGGDSRWLVLESGFGSRSSTDDPDSVITDLEYSAYEVQAQADSGTRDVSAWHRFFSRESHVN
jgi:hypothetical protein